MLKQQTLGASGPYRNAVGGCNSPTRRFRITIHFIHFVEAGGENQQGWRRDCAQRPWARGRNTTIDSPTVAFKLSRAIIVIEKRVKVSRPLNNKSFIPI